MHYIVKLYILVNIKIWCNVKFYIDKLYKKFDIKVTQYNKIPNYPEENEIRYKYFLNNDTVKFSTNIDGLIEVIEHTENYYREKYKNKLY